MKIKRNGRSSFMRTGLDWKIQMGRDSFELLCDSTTVRDGCIAKGRIKRTSFGRCWVVRWRYQKLARMHGMGTKELVLNIGRVSCDFSSFSLYYFPTPRHLLSVSICCLYSFDLRPFTSTGIFDLSRLSSRSWGTDGWMRAGLVH
jgi:hypothetical protein